MPELPEVQTVINDLQTRVLNKKVTAIISFRQGTVINKLDQNDIFPFQISNINRRGKYIIFHTDKDFQIVAHLRMTGKFIYHKDSTFEDAYIRAQILLDDKTSLLFKDVRCFGTIQLVKNYHQLTAFQKLGVEPLSKEFSVNYLKDKLKNRTAPIKNILLNQNIIAGLGNIYANEILFRGKISPLKRANKLSLKNLKSIVQNTKDVLSEALKKNGTTIHDFHSVDEKTGEFQSFLQVYQKKNCPCGNTIKRIKQAGRSTFYCTICQK